MWTYCTSFFSLLFCYLMHFSIPYASYKRWLRNTTFWCLAISANTSESEKKSERCLHIQFSESYSGIPPTVQFCDCYISLPGFSSMNLVWSRQQRLFARAEVEKSRTVAYLNAIAVLFTLSVSSEMPILSVKFCGCFVFIL